MPVTGGLSSAATVVGGMTAAGAAVVISQETGIAIIILASSIGIAVIISCFQNYDMEAKFGDVVFTRKK